MELKGFMEEVKELVNKELGDGYNWFGEIGKIGFW